MYFVKSVILAIWLLCIIVELRSKSKIGHLC